MKTITCKLNKREKKANTKFVFDQQKISFMHSNRSLFICPVYLSVFDSINEFPTYFPRVTCATNTPVLISREYEINSDTNFQMAFIDTYLNG